MPNTTERPPPRREQAKRLGRTKRRGERGLRCRGDTTAETPAAKPQALGLSTRRPPDIPTKRGIRRPASQDPAPLDRAPAGLGKRTAPVFPKFRATPAHLAARTKYLPWYSLASAASANAHPENSASLRNDRTCSAGGPHRGWPDEGQSRLPRVGSQHLLALLACFLEFPFRHRWIPSTESVDCT